jgi:undecaprenyl-diphosphatase
MGLSYILKRVFKRVRPLRKEGSFGHALRDGSFPSGHSLTAFAFWMMCVFALALIGASIASTLLFAVVAIAIVFLTGLSRIYMAVHWPSDVAGGFVIGAVWTVVCFFALRGAL